jgi:hypothetical protein
VRDVVANLSRDHDRRYHRRQELKGKKKLETKEKKTNLIAEKIIA